MSSEAVNRAVRASLVQLQGVYEDRALQIAQDAAQLLGNAPMSPQRRSQVALEAAGAQDAVRWCARVVQAAIRVIDDHGRTV